MVPLDHNQPSMLHSPHHYGSSPHSRSPLSTNPIIDHLRYLSPRMATVSQSPGAATSHTSGVCVAKPAADIQPFPSTRGHHIQGADGSMAISGNLEPSRHGYGEGVGENGSQLKGNVNQEVDASGIAMNMARGWDQCTPYTVKICQEDDKARNLEAMVDEQYSSTGAQQMPSNVGEYAGGNVAMVMKGGSRCGKVRPCLDDDAAYGDGVLQHTTPKSSQASSVTPFPKSLNALVEQKDVRIAMESAESRSVKPPAKNIVSKLSLFFSRSSFYALKGLPVPRHLLIADWIVRSASAVFALVTFCVMVSTHETRSGAGSTFQVKFSDFQAYQYLVALNLLSFLYSTAQMTMSIISQSKDSRIDSFTAPIKSGACKYVLDLLLAFLLFSASSSAATASQLAIHGLRNIWPPACSTWKLWMLCTKADAAVAISFLSSVSMIICSLLSGFRLLNLLLL